MTNSLLHTIHLLLNNYFWLLLATGPIAFFTLRPLAKERRQQAIDPIYKECARAYAQFKKLPEGSDPKWQAFLNFLAAYFDIKAKHGRPAILAPLLKKQTLTHKLLLK